MIRFTPSADALTRYNLFPDPGGDGVVMAIVPPVDHERDGLQFAGLGRRLRPIRPSGLLAFAKTAGARVHLAKVRRATPGVNILVQI